MSTAFVPMTVSAAPRGDTTFTALSVKNTPAATSATASIPGAHNCATQPVITVRRNGDLVTQIRIECGCGQIIELACQY